MTLTFNFTDVENAEAKFDLAIRSNKWEGEDEDEDVKVLPLLISYFNL